MSSKNLQPLLLPCEIGRALPCLSSFLPELSSSLWFFRDLICNILRLVSSTLGFNIFTKNHSSHVYLKATFLRENTDKAASWLGQKEKDRIPGGKSLGTGLFSSYSYTVYQELWAGNKTKLTSGKSPERLYLTMNHTTNTVLFLPLISTAHIICTMVSML